MLDKQLQQSLLSRGISERQLGQYPSKINAKSSPWSACATVTEESSTVMVIAPYPSNQKSTMLHPIVGPAGSVGAASILPAIPVEGKCMLGEFAVKRLAHLALSDLIIVSTGDDNQRIDNDVNASDALLFAGGPDVSCLIIGWGHFGPPVVC